jgi:hypothetical protein
MSARNNVLLPPTYVFEANIAVLCNITRNWKQNKKQQKEPKHFVWRDLKCFVCSCMPSKISFVCVYLILHQTLTEAAFKLKTFPMFSQSFTIRAAAITRDGQNDNKFASTLKKKTGSRRNEIACREFIG